MPALDYPANFDASNTNNSLKNRSDDKGPEPESVVVGELGGASTRSSPWSGSAA